MACAAVRVAWTDARRRAVVHGVMWDPHLSHRCARPVPPQLQPHLSACSDPLAPVHVGPSSSTAFAPITLPLTPQAASKPVPSNALQELLPCMRHTSFTYQSHPRIFKVVSSPPAVRRHIQNSLKAPSPTHDCDPAQRFLLLGPLRITHFPLVPSGRLRAGAQQRATGAAPGAQRRTARLLAVRQLVRARPAHQVSEGEGRGTAC